MAVPFGFTAEKVIKWLADVAQDKDPKAREQASRGLIEWVEQFPEDMPAYAEELMNVVEHGSALSRYHAMTVLVTIPKLPELDINLLASIQQRDEKLYNRMMAGRILEKLVGHVKVAVRKRESSKALNPERIELSKLNWDRRAKFALWLMQHTNESLYITGRAGTGKSTLLRAFRSSTEKKVVVLAPTGLAAIQVDGQTIHSFFRFPSRMITSKDIKKLFDDRVIRQMDTLVIDEISMVRADVMDAIHRSLQLHRKSPLPFGGVQVIMFGDLFQLPPVVNNQEADMLNMVYPSPYFFSANAFSGFKPVLIELTKIHRQRDDSFIELLNQVREDRLEESALAWLNTRVLNAKEPPDDYLILTTVNAKAKRINDARLEKLPTESFVYAASVEGEFNDKDFPTEPEMMLKIGARVMFIRNDPDGRWVNGSLGTVSHLERHEIRVEVDGEEVEVTPEKWENMRFQYDMLEDKIESETIGTFLQYPLKLAYALTIHKSQGQTFDRVMIDMDRGAFAHGQTYVALSRCRTFEGVLLSRPIRMQDILFDEEVYNMRSRFQDGSTAYQDYAERFKMARKALREGQSVFLTAAQTRLPVSALEQLGD